VVELAEGSEVVEFTATDGVRLTGRVFGSGSTMVVLSHMGATGSSQEDWFPLATLLADEGYAVLTYNSRGVCSVAYDECSDGPGRFDQRHLDVAGAAAFALESADRVVLGGASLGAMASLEAALDGLAEPAGLIWLAGILDGEYEFTRGDVGRRLPPVPVLLASTRDDTFGAGPDARLLQHWIGDRADLHLLPGRDHGTQLLDADAPPDVRERVSRTVVEFLDGLAD
jgi:alpha-beta hydrolase superfamily lysophospholipase